MDDNSSAVLEKDQPVLLSFSDIPLFGHFNSTDLEISMTKDGGIYEKGKAIGPL
jgi:hypothetical protein